MRKGSHIINKLFTLYIFYWVTSSCSPYINENYRYCKIGSESEEVYLSLINSEAEIVNNVGGNSYG